MTKQEIADAIRTTETRIRRLSASIAARPDAKLPEGTWAVRDALSHVAARCNTVPLSLEIAEGLLRGEPRQVSNIDDINHGQVEERRNASVEQLIQECRDGLAAALKAVDDLDEEFLTKMVPSFRGDGEMSIGELVHAATPRHVNNHLDQIEQALAS